MRLKSSKQYFILTLGATHAASSMSPTKKCANRSESNCRWEADNKG